MSESTAEILKGDLVTINPSIDYNDGVAYIGVYLPCKITNGDKQKPITATHHFLISSQRKAIHTLSQLPEGTILSTTPMRIKSPQWQRNDIAQWLETDSKIDPIEVYNQTRKKLEYYFEFSNDPTYDIVTLWSIGSYFYHIFPAYPYLFINGPKRTGKSKLLLFLKPVCHNAFMSSSITTAALQRTIESLRSTLLIDEHEFFSNRHKLSERQMELRAALLDGYHIGSEALKVEGDKDKRVNTYATYSPKALANIAGLDDILEDRCIYILMQRALGPQKNTEIDVTDHEWIDIKNKLHRLYLENASVLSELSAVCAVDFKAVQSRDRQLWLSLVTLARFFEERGIKNLTNSIIEYARSMSNMKSVEEQETHEVILVHALNDLVKSSDWYTPTTIKYEFQEVLKECDPDSDISWVNNKVVGRMLKRIGLADKRRVSTGMEYYITVEAVQTLKERYQVDEKTSTQTTETTLSTPRSSKLSLIWQPWTLQNKELDPLYIYSAVPAPISSQDNRHATSSVVGGDS